MKNPFPFGYFVPSQRSQNVTEVFRFRSLSIEPRETHSSSSLPHPFSQSPFTHKFGFHAPHSVVDADIYEQILNGTNPDRGVLALLNRLGDVVLRILIGAGRDLQNSVVFAAPNKIVMMYEGRTYLGIVRKIVRTWQNCFESKNLLPRRFWNAFHPDLVDRYLNLLDGNLRGWATNEGGVRPAHLDENGMYKTPANRQTIYLSEPDVQSERIFIAAFSEEAFGPFVSLGRFRSSFDRFAEACQQEQQSLGSIRCVEFETRGAFEQATAHPVISEIIEQLESLGLSIQITSNGLDSATSTTTR